MEKWYYIKDGDKKGPFTIDELKDKNINPDTLVWTETIKDWEKAKYIEPIKGIIVTEPPPIPEPKMQQQDKKTQEQASSNQIDNQEYFGYELAKRRYRFLACLVEGIIIVVVQLIFVFSWGVGFDNIPDRPLFEIADILYSVFFGILIGAIFYPLFTGNIGHRIFGMKVISSETGKDYKSSLQGATRETLKNVLGWLIIPIIWILFDKKKQNLYDKITKTLVVKRKE